MKQEHTTAETIIQNLPKTDTGVGISRIKDIKAVRMVKFHVSQKLSRNIEEKRHIILIEMKASMNEMKIYSVEKEQQKYLKLKNMEKKPKHDE